VVKNGRKINYSQKEAIKKARKYWAYALGLAVVNVSVFKQ
jgi:hypothetical protein